MTRGRRPIASQLLLRLLLTLCVLTAPAFANTIQVAADQKTIQAGIEAASNGDTVLIAPGTY
jgi:hypothetical protein